MNGFRKLAEPDLPAIEAAGLRISRPAVAAFVKRDGAARLGILPHQVISLLGSCAPVPYMGDVCRQNPIAAGSLYVVYRIPPRLPDNSARVCWRALRRDRFAETFAAGGIPVGSYVAAEIIVPATVGASRIAGVESVSEEWRTPGIQYA